VVPKVSSHCWFLGMEQGKLKAKVHLICITVTGVSLWRSEASLQPILATRSPLFLNILPRHWRNAFVASELCHQSSAELVLARALSGFPNSRTPSCPSSSVRSRLHALPGSHTWCFRWRPACLPGHLPARGLVEMETQKHQIELHGHYFQESLDRLYERQLQRSS